MRKVLLYAPELIGHPRVYCRVIADALAPEPCEIDLALGFTDEVGLAECPDLWALTDRARVEILDARSWSEAGQPQLRAEELLRLQRDRSVDVTLFVEGDKSSEEFRRISRGECVPLRGRNLAIFANTAEWYPREDSFTGAPRRLLAPTVRTTLGNVKRAMFGRRYSARHFFERILLGGRVIDELLVKDERLAEWHGPPVFWMPEISRPAPMAESEEERAERVRREAELTTFLAANLDREPLLYFGDAAFYKGYDILLAFAARRPQTCVVHAGLGFDETQRGYFELDAERLRTMLRAEGRLLETTSYVHTQRLKELYFGAVKLFVTTHRLALSSSTVIQACELGKPVLVPDRGLLGHRVRTHGLGGVYAYGDLDDLERQAERLWASDLARFAGPTRRFWSRFSDEAIRKFFVDRLARD